MERLFETTEILKLFPWGCLENDVRAEFDVLGGANYG